MSRPVRPALFKSRATFRERAAAARCAIGGRDGLPQRPGFVVQAVAYLGGDDHPRIARSHAGHRLDVVADPRLGLGEAARLRDADTGDVQLPPVPRAWSGALAAASGFSPGFPWLSPDAG